ncbi:MAG: helix-turn-helix transcriptional regulator [Spirochaetales bacterium]|nr:helix-turn-helix transcriptional regulator [Candidatus Physcosoma equi]
MRLNYFPNRILIDVEATSNRLKALRLANGFSIQEIQEIMGFTSPVSVYAWENPKKKSIPCIENMDLLARLYNVHVEDLYITKDISLNHITFSDSWSQTEEENEEESVTLFPEIEIHPMVCYVF